MIITRNSFQEIFDSVINFVEQVGEEVSPRGALTKEVTNLSFKLRNPDNNTISNSHIDPDYAITLKEYILDGGKNLGQLEKLRPGVSKYVESENFHVNYGERIEQSYDFIKAELISDPSSRRAIIPIISLDDISMLVDREDEVEFPCCESIQFFIRKDELHCSVVMRSQNIYGIMPYDVYCFTSLQIKLAYELGISVGTYTHFMKSAHIYLNK